LRPCMGKEKLMTVIRFAWGKKGKGNGPLEEQLIKEKKKQAHQGRGDRLAGQIFEEGPLMDTHRAAVERSHPIASPGKRHPPESETFGGRRPPGPWTKCTPPRTGGSGIPSAIRPPHQSAQNPPVPGPKR